MTKLRTSQVEASPSFPRGIVDRLSSKSAEISIAKKPKESAPVPKSTSLPVDAYREEILRKVQSDRVVIIHGETGCGKSSRIPVSFHLSLCVSFHLYVGAVLEVILYEDAMANNRRCRMMVAQPRRIAASTLMKRVSSSVGHSVVALRMGHGIRDGDEGDQTAIIFGYFQLFNDISALHF